MSQALGFWFDLATGLAAAILCLGSAWRLVGLARRPQPWPIVLTPAPRGRVGVLVRLLAETVLFRSLWRASRWTWLGCALLHYGLLVVLIAHLRFAFEILPLWLLPWLLASGYASAAMIVGLLVLLGRRLSVDRIRHITTPSDLGYLVLLLLVAGSGWMLKRVWPVDLAAVGGWFRAIPGLSYEALPVHPPLLAHIATVIVLLLVFPLGKLLHGPLVWLAPTWNARLPRATRDR